MRNRRSGGQGVLCQTLVARFTALEEAANEFSATTIAAGVGGAVIGVLVCEVDVAASVRLIARRLIRAVKLVAGQTGGG